MWVEVTIDELEMLKKNWNEKSQLKKDVEKNDSPSPTDAILDPKSLILSEEIVHFFRLLPNGLKTSVIDKLLSILSEYKPIQSDSENKLTAVREMLTSFKNDRLIDVDENDLFLMLAEAVKILCPDFKKNAINIKKFLCTSLNLTEERIIAILFHDTMFHPDLLYDYLGVIFGSVHKLQYYAMPVAQRMVGDIQQIYRKLLGGRANQETRLKIDNSLYKNFLGHLVSKKHAITQFSYDEDYLKIDGIEYKSKNVVRKYYNEFCDFIRLRQIDTINQFTSDWWGYSIRQQ